MAAPCPRTVGAAPARTPGQSADKGVTLKSLSHLRATRGNAPTEAPPRRPHRRSLAFLSVVALLGAVALSPLAAAEAAPKAPAVTQPDLGPNVRVFDPSMPVADIQKAVDAVRDQQIANQFGTERVALLFKPGTYGTAATPLIVEVGYYTEVVGLGKSPGDVTINGHVDVYNQCDANGCIALNNFWRGVSNLTINVAGGAGCHASANFWAVSQAAPMRRVHVTGGNLTFMDYCTGPSFASGGFVADSSVDGTVINGSQQQFYVRDSHVGSWSNGVWNQVFSGVEGAPAQCFPAVAGGCGPYTTLATTPASREKPYLYVDAAGAWNVFVPAARTSSSGPTWTNGGTAGRSIPLTDFYVTRPGDSAKTLNTELARGKNLLVTPGVYDIDRAVDIKRADTVVLGLGLATFTATNGNTAIRVADVQGVDVAGLTIDAGAKNSAVLMEIGSGSHDGNGQAGDQHGNSAHGSSAANPTGIQDVFFRIGGPHLGKATVSLVVNSDHVILDDIWAWRADHGEGVGWTQNTADTGVIVNGDDVTATGLFVEHYQKTEVIWRGERGRTVFFQNELPYDVPNQAAWTDHGVNGYVAYLVDPSVTTHEAWGLGSYSFFNQGVDIHEDHSFEVPVTPGVTMHDLLTIFLDPVNGSGSIDHVINQTGGSSSKANPDVPVTVTTFP
ncbi:MAG: hypothetical protein JWP61_1565 [Friedmanniella sp.]|nr:hypothetical protein [Friedmanniella sp.]